MNERYTGGKDIYVELPEGHDVQHIDWLSVRKILNIILNIFMIIYNLIIGLLPSFRS
jgi:hypothetical protein